MSCAALLLALFPGYQETRPAAARALVVGRATDEQGRPLPGVGVAVGSADTILTADALERPLARTDADGRFAVAIPEALLATGRAAPAVLWAAPGRVALRWCDPFLGSPVPWPSPCAETLEAGVLRMFPGTDLRGRVLGPDGQGIDGARVRVLDLLSWRGMGSTVEPASFTTTRADGAFVARGVAAAGLVVHVSAPGYLDQVLQGLATDAPAEVQLRPGGFVTGRVTDGRGSGRSAVLYVRYETDQDAVAVDGTRGQGDAALAAGGLGMSPTGFMPAQTVRTGDDGTFRVPVRFPGLLRLCAMAPGATRPVDSRLLTGPRDGLELVLPEPAEVEARVRFVDRATRKAVAGVRGVVLWSGTAYPEPVLDRGLAVTAALAPAVSDADGVLRLRLPASCALHGRMRAFAEGHAPVGAFALWSDGAAAPAITAELVRPARLEGRVLDETSDEPVPDAEVECRTHATGPILGRARCSPDGEFAIGGLYAGHLAVQVRHGDRISPWRVVAFADEELKGMSLTLPAGRRVTVRCRGALPPDAWLVLERGRPSARWKGDTALHFERVREVRPGADGALVLPSLSPAAYRLVASWPGPTLHQPPLCATVGEFVVADADMDTAADLGPHAPATITGRVRAEGERLPPGRCVVVAIPEAVEEAPDRYYLAWNAPWARSCLIGPDGSFRLTVPAGSHRLRVVDGVTGITLRTDDEAAQVAAGASTARELGVTAVSVPLEVVGGQSQLLGLDFEVEQTGASLHPAEPHLWLGDGTRTVSLLLPPGPVTVRTATSAWKAVAGGAAASQCRKAESLTRGELELTVAPGTTERRQLALPPRPALPEELLQK